MILFFGTQFVPKYVNLTLQTNRPIQKKSSVIPLQDITDFLSSRGHLLNREAIGSSVVCAIAREEDGKVYANADFRKGGGVDGF